MTNLKKIGLAVVVIGLIAVVIEYLTQLCLPAVGSEGGCHYLLSPDGVIPLYSTIILIVGLLIVVYSYYMKK